ncbi:MAG: META domain-containing protein [Gemmatimonadetes bacterium]|nr:META domain-containing protein [Gemmatimonadota bacterium]
MSRAWHRVTIIIGALTLLSGCGRGADGRSRESVSGDSAAVAARPPAPSVSGTLMGLYVDVEAGPLFTECGTSRQWRVQPVGAAGELERAYVAARSHEGDAARVTVAAHSVSRGDGGIGVLAVDRVMSVSSETVCPGQWADAPLTGTTWRMVGLADRDLAGPYGEVTLRLDRETGGLQLATACRTLTGTFRWVGTELTFGGIDVGDDRCAGSGEDEATSLDAELLNVLRATGSYTIRVDTLALMGESGALARFVTKGGS